MCFFCWCGMNCEICGIVWPGDNSLCLNVRGAAGISSESWNGLQLFFALPDIWRYFYNCLCDVQIDGNQNILEGLEHMGIA